MDIPEEFCLRWCSNRDEHKYMSEYGRKCSNCPVEDWLEYEEHLKEANQ